MHVAVAGTAAFHAQRLLLLELVVDPPDLGDDLNALAQRLALPRRDLESAAAALCSAGLAEVSTGMVRASQTALAFDTLWPICL